MAANQGYYTVDRKRMAEGGFGPQYDEIPYGDVAPGGGDAVAAAAPASQMANGHSGKGQLPEVPAEYSQVPQIPARQGAWVYAKVSTSD